MFKITSFFIILIDVFSLKEFVKWITEIFGMFGTIWLIFLFTGNQVGFNGNFLWNHLSDKPTSVLYKMMYVCVCVFNLGS